MMKLVPPGDSHISLPPQGLVFWTTDLSCPRRRCVDRICRPLLASRDPRPLTRGLLFAVGTLGPASCLRPPTTKLLAFGARPGSSVSIKPYPCSISAVLPLIPNSSHLERQPRPEFHLDPVKRQIAPVGYPYLGSDQKRVFASHPLGRRRPAGAIESAPAFARLPPAPTWKTNAHISKRKSYRYTSCTLSLTDCSLHSDLLIARFSRTITLALTVFDNHTSSYDSKTESHDLDRVFLLQDHASRYKPESGSFRCRTHPFPNLFSHRNAFARRETPHLFRPSSCHFDRFLLRTPSSVAGTASLEPRSRERSQPQPSKSRIRSMSERKTLLSLLQS